MTAPTGGLSEPNRIQTSLGGVPFNAEHIEYWKARAKRAEAELTALRERCEAADHRNVEWARGNLVRTRELVAANVRADTMKEALRPFAGLADAIECTSTHTYFDHETWEVPIGDLRRARDAFAAAIDDELTGRRAVAEKGAASDV